MQVLGTPSEHTWEGLNELPDFQTKFPRWRGQNLKLEYAMLSANGVSLLEELLTYDPRQRLIGKDALNHAYFADFDRDAIGKGPLR